jgi:hypothetical protein
MELAIMMERDSLVVASSWGKGGPFIGPLEK